MNWWCFKCRNPGFYGPYCSMCGAVMVHRDAFLAGIASFEPLPLEVPGLRSPWSVLVFGPVLEGK